MDQNGPFWPVEVHFGPFRSANRTLAIPDKRWGLKRMRERKGLCCPGAIRSPPDKGEREAKEGR